MTDDEIIHRKLDTDTENPGVAVAEAVADIEGRDATELTSTYKCADDVLNNLFSNPPDPEAQMEITFSYEGYRITVEQNGSAEFVRLD
jgi:hypothetical protein